MMAIDHIEETSVIPFDHDAIVAGGERLAEFWRLRDQQVLLKRFNELEIRLNALLDANTIDYIYFSSRNQLTGLYPSGTWREGVSDSGTFVRQKLVDGEWVTVTEDDV